MSATRDHSGNTVRSVSDGEMHDGSLGPGSLFLGLRNQERHDDSKQPMVLVLVAASHAQYEDEAAFNFAKVNHFYTTQIIGHYHRSTRSVPSDVDARWQPASLFHSSKLLYRQTHR